jgi:RNA recognition motif-containing protein
MVKLFVGNLSYDVEDQELRTLLQRAGRVTDVYMPLDRVTQRRRGFAMVEVPTDADARDIIREFNGYPLRGRSLRIDYARAREAVAVPAKYRSLYPPKGRPEPRPRRPERSPAR